VADGGAVADEGAVVGVVTGGTIGGGFCVCVVEVAAAAVDVVDDAAVVPVVDGLLSFATALLSEPSGLLCVLVVALPAVADLSPAAVFEAGGPGGVPLSSARNRSGAASANSA
jgi:hypothetical protein